MEPLAVLSPIRSHSFFLIKLTDLFFQKTFLDQQCFPFHDRPFELQSHRILFMITVCWYILQFSCFRVLGTMPSIFVACHFPAQDWAQRRCPNTSELTKQSLWRQFFSFSKSYFPSFFHLPLLSTYVNTVLHLAEPKHSQAPLHLLPLSQGLGPLEVTQKPSALPPSHLVCDHIYGSPLENMNAHAQTWVLTVRPQRLLCKFMRARASLSLFSLASTKALAKRTP